MSERDPSGRVSRQRAFYLLHLEYESENAVADVHPSKGPDRRGRRKNRNRTTTVKLFGKLEDDTSAVIRLVGFRPCFYVSFGSLELAKDVFESLNGSMQNDPNGPICGLTPLKDVSSMAIDKEHQSAGTGARYGDTRLTNVFRVSVRDFRDIRGVGGRTKAPQYGGGEDGDGASAGSVSAVNEIYRKVFEFDYGHGMTDSPLTAVKLYESNADPCVHIVNRIAVSPCSWTTICEDDFDDVVRKNDCALTVFEHRLTRSRVLDDGGGRFLGKHDSVYESLFSRVAARDDLPPHPRVSVMSFDIECVCYDVNSFPDADSDPVIQISAIVTTTDNLVGGTSGHASWSRHLFCTRDCASIEDVEIRSYDDESGMLKGFAEFIVRSDPDVLTGYNIQAFDLPYLVRRMERNGLTGRFGKAGAKVSSSRTFGGDGNSRQQSVVTVPGRVVFDAYLYVKKEFPMKSLKLNAVATSFLNLQKDDVHYSEIPRLYDGDAETRAVLGKYCVKDAELVLEIIRCKQSFLHMFERCRVFRTLFAYMTTRGQQVRVESMLTWYCREKNVLINDFRTAAGLFGSHTSTLQYRLNKKAALASTSSKSCVPHDDDDDDGRRFLERRGELDGDEDAPPSKRPRYQASDGRDPVATDQGGKSVRANYDGASVLTPKVGLYHASPVACLDFASLYPSIMIGYNLCHTTLVSDDVDGEELTSRGLAERSPVGHYFLRAETKKGILPDILENLLTERDAVKRRMKDARLSDTERSVLDGQQSALKLAANSMYGDCGAQKGKLFNVAIPSSVTAYGRRLLFTAKAFIESSHDGVEIVYGDTDSLMVHMRWIDDDRIWRAADASEAMATGVTEHIARTPIRLQAENVFRPFLLVSKKRYAYSVQESLTAVAKVARERGDDVASAMLAAAPPKLKFKGLEIVRRDNCQFASELQRCTLEQIMVVGREYDHRTVIASVKERLGLLLNGRVQTDCLIIHKEWKRHTKNPTPHDELAKKLATRDPGSAPRPGDRLQYVIVRGAGPLATRSEDPKYVSERGLQVDYGYYAKLIANQLSTVLSVAVPGELSKKDVLKLIWPDGHVCPTDRSASKRNKWSSPPERNKFITDFFSKK